MRIGNVFECAHLSKGYLVNDDDVFPEGHGRVQLACFAFEAAEALFEPGSKFVELGIDKSGGGIIQLMSTGSAVIKAGVEVGVGTWMYGDG